MRAWDRSPARRQVVMSKSLVFASVIFFWVSSTWPGPSRRRFAFCGSPLLRCATAGHAEFLPVTVVCANRPIDCILFCTVYTLYTCPFAYFSPVYSILSHRVCPSTHARRMIRCSASLPIPSLSPITDQPPLSIPFCEPRAAKAVRITAQYCLPCIGSRTLHDLHLYT